MNQIENNYFKDIFVKCLFLKAIGLVVMYALIADQL